MPGREQPVIDFVVHGPFDVPTYPSEKRLDDEYFRKDFWKKNDEIARLAVATGCYVYAIRSKAMIPWYVGMTTASFRSECTNVSNLLKIATRLMYKHGTTVLFLVEYQRRKGKPNNSAIREVVETFLITSAYAKNPELLS